MRLPFATRLADRFTKRGPGSLQRSRLSTCTGWKCPYCCRSSPVSASTAASRSCLRMSGSHFRRFHRLECWSVLRSTCGHWSIPRQFSRGRIVVSATAPLPRDLASRIETRLGAVLIEFFGSTETCVIATRRTAREDWWRPYSGVRLQPGRSGTMWAPRGSPEISTFMTSLKSAMTAHSRSSAGAATSSRWPASAPRLPI